jgi:small subunit ribosomal protein S20
MVGCQLSVAGYDTAGVYPWPSFFSSPSRFECKLSLNNHEAMPSSSSAKKRVRQNAKRKKQNRVAKKVIKTLTKRAAASLAAKDLDKAATDIKGAASKIDKAGARRVLHPNTAARRKSKLARAYNAALAKTKSGTPPA